VLSAARLFGLVAKLQQAGAQLRKNEIALQSLNGARTYLLFSRSDNA
jgi:hypothetical protein